MRYLTMLAVVLSLVVMPQLVVADTGIYKWVDDEGQTHYGERPKTKDAVKLKPASQTFVKQDKTAGEEAKEKEFAEKCEQAKEKLKGYKEAPFLYKTDDTGAKIRLTEQETDDVMFDAEKDMNYWCNPPEEEEQAK